MPRHRRRCVGTDAGIVSRCPCPTAHLIPCLSHRVRNRGPGAIAARGSSRPAQPNSMPRPGRPLRGLRRPDIRAARRPSGGLQAAGTGGTCLTANPAKILLSTLTGPSIFGLETGNVTKVAWDVDTSVTDVRLPDPRQATPPPIRWSSCSDVDAIAARSSSTSTLPPGSISRRYWSSPERRATTPPFASRQQRPAILAGNQSPTLVKHIGGRSG